MSAKAEIEIRIAKLERRISTCWEMATTYIENKDPHGLHDIGVDIQLLAGAIRELRAIQSCCEEPVTPTRTGILSGQWVPCLDQTTPTTGGNLTL